MEVRVEVRVEWWSGGESGVEVRVEWWSGGESGVVEWR